MMKRIEKREWLNKGLVNSDEGKAKEKTKSARLSALVMYYQ
jgi:hypothetical protein